MNQDTVEKSDASDAAQPPGHPESQLSLDEALLAIRCFLEGALDFCGDRAYRAAFHLLERGEPISSAQTYRCMVEFLEEEVELGGAPASKALRELFLAQGATASTPRPAALTWPEAVSMARARGSSYPETTQQLFNKENA